MFWKSLTNASHFPVNPEKDLKTKMDYKWPEEQYLEEALSV